MSDGIFNYDVFVSYKSEQASWAIRLAETLAGFGLNVWRDQDGIRAGEQWAPTLKRAIEQSRAMVVLWSNLLATDANSVAHQEINEMNRLMMEERSGERRFVPVSLDGTRVDAHPVLGAYQASNLDFADSHQLRGDGGAAEVSSIDWASAMRGLVAALQVSDVTEVRFASAAMTREQAEDLEHSPERFAQEPNVYRTVRNLMDKTGSFDKSRYGGSPDDWKPFLEIVDNPSVREFIHEYDSAKREWFRQSNEHSKWLLVSYSDELMSPNLQTWQEARDHLRDGPCLIIVDPVSLLHKQVYSRVMIDLAIQGHSEACVIGISPFALRLHQSIRELVDDVEKQLEMFLRPAYDRFLKFFEAGSRICVLEVEHEYQFARWLQVAGDRICMAQKTPMRVQRRHPTRRFRRAQLAPDQRIRLMGQGQNQ